MGDLIRLNDHRRARPGAGAGRRTGRSSTGFAQGYGVAPPAAVHDLPTAPRAVAVAFYFDVSCPFSYLAAERVERLLGAAEWIPAAGVALQRGNPWCGSDPAKIEAARARAETRAAELRLPLVWPDRPPGDAPMALRACAYAAEVGAGARFALAAARLAYCGGFDLEDPETLAEAAAAAGIKLHVCLAAARDESRDGRLCATSRGLLSTGVLRLPAVRVGGRWFGGERSLAGAMAAAAAG
jgi:2-hydroxychromene-2-carboxylate isomerase